MGASGTKPSKNPMAALTVPTICATLWASTAASDRRRPRWSRLTVGAALDRVLLPPLVPGALEDGPAEVLATGGALPPAAAAPPSCCNSSLGLPPMLLPEADAS